MDTQRIGPYRIEAPFGTGGMGQVYRGWDERHDRPVVLKRLKSGSPYRDAAQRFRREIHLHARLHHPSIVEVYEIIESGGAVWLVMELVEGQSIQALLAQQGAFSVERTVEIARDVIAGLGAAHAAGVVHRDLKADNVMVDAEGRAKILDFGLARAFEPTESMPNLTLQGSILGTAAAMSPEQSLGEPVDQRSDFFSLGSMLYEMLSGTSPFRGKHVVETLIAIQAAEVKPLREVAPQVPAALSDFVGRLLARDPAHRPQSAAAATRELEQAYQHRA